MAEELRRAGNVREAIGVCRAGLTAHPGYLSARVTLGRALMEVGQLAAAEVEFSEVLRKAPENLAALRGNAEIHHRRGELEEALSFYKSALTLARFAPDLERHIETLTRILNPPAPQLPELERFLDAIHTYRQRRAV